MTEGPGAAPETTQDTEYITIGEGARRLGVSERTLRRILTRREYAAEMRPVTRRTKTGTRQAAAFPPRLLEALQRAIEHESNGIQNAANGGGANAADNAAPRPTLTKTRQAPSSALVAEYADRLLAERDRVIVAHEQRIAEQAARIEALEAALERSQDALAREQTIRALPAPEATPRRPWWKLWG